MTHTDDPIDPRLLEKLEYLRAVPPRNPDAVQHGRAKFLAQVQNIRQSVSKLPKRRHNGWFETINNLFSQKERKPMLTTLFSILIAIVLLFGGAGATAYAAQDDLPGDSLYSVKTFTEDARLVLSLNKASDVVLYQQFNQQRVNEMSSLAEKGRFDDIPTAANRFKLHTNQATQLVSQLTSVDPTQAESLHLQLQSTQDQQTLELENVRAMVSVKAQLSIDEALRAMQPGLETEYVGIVESISPDAWVIAGWTVLITPQTEIKGDILVGALVKAHVLVGDDGALTAREIELFEAGSEFNFSGIVEAMAPELWTISGLTVGISTTTEIEDGIVVGDLVSVKASVAADGSMLARNIDLVDHQGGNEFELTGAVDVITPEAWTISGQVVLITTLTQIEQGIEIGSVVKLEGVVAPDGALVAREIALLDGHEGNANQNENGNENENENGNENANGNDNGNENANGNDDDDNDNGNDNGNENGNGNDNANDNDNDNGNENGNGNANENGNDNDNDDDNGNENGNGNANDNDNGNENGNDDDNENGNDDDNGNDNDNGLIIIHILPVG